MQLSIRKLRVILSFALLIEARSFAPKIIKISGLLLKPVPSFLKSVHGWMPATAGVVTTHALSGATTEVKSYQGNSLSVKTGENVSFRFYTSRYTAGSYRVSGLPNGLSYDGRNTISGSISEAGNYSVNIVGYRGYSQNGSSTPTFLLSVDASDPVLPLDSDGDGVDDSSDSFPDDPKRASGSDFDSDGTDDEFDNDDDNDGVVDTSDLYPKDALRASGNDADGDGTDDEFDGDRDGDGVDNATDQFPDDPKRASGSDFDGDGTDDEFDDDDDNDGIVDTSDLYPKDALRATGNDADGDGTDDEFDGDRDGDGVDNTTDQFPDDPKRASADDLAGDSNETMTTNFSSTTNLGNNWFDAWLGIFYTANKQNWIFHSHLGWFYVHPVGKDAFWFYDYDLGWLYTSNDLYPYFYRNSPAGWLYHLANSNKSRFWSYSQEIELE